MGVYFYFEPVLLAEELVRGANYRLNKLTVLEEGLNLVYLGGKLLTALGTLRTSLNAAAYNIGKQEKIQLISFMNGINASFKSLLLSLNKMITEIVITSPLVAAIRRINTQSMLYLIDKVYIYIDKSIYIYNIIYD
ncbi:Hypothetical_protein [Hexamita inflata]|uniref:Hypothetical_protein n=1 Tax=Hexamita inflata TaxID=28002 RepID=A0ABP1H9B5_9EUKA